MFKSVGYSLALSLTFLQPLLSTTAAAAPTISPELTGSVEEPGRSLYAVFGANGVLQRPVTLATPGQVLVKQQVTQPPSVGVRSADLPRNASSASSRYALIVVDPDTNITEPTNTMLNYIASDMTLGNMSLPASSINVSALSSGREVAPWLTPDAPSAELPANFIVMLFKQPSNLAVPDRFQSFLALSYSQRRNFPLLDFLNSTGLGLTPFAATYFSEGGAGNSSIVVGASNSTGAPQATAASSAMPSFTTSYTYTYNSPTPTASTSASSAAGAASTSQTAKPTAGMASGRSTAFGTLLGAIMFVAGGLVLL